MKDNPIRHTGTGNSFRNFGRRYGLILAMSKVVAVSAASWIWSCANSLWGLDCTRLKCCAETLTETHLFVNNPRDRQKILTMFETETDHLQSLRQIVTIQLTLEYIASVGESLGSERTTASSISPQKNVNVIVCKSACRYILPRMAVRQFSMRCAFQSFDSLAFRTYHVSLSTVAITVSGVIASRFSRARSGCASHSLDDSVFINEHSLRATTACLSHGGAHWMRLEAPNKATVGVFTAVLRCIGPVSLLMYRLHRCRSAASCIGVA